MCCYLFLNLKVNFSGPSWISKYVILSLNNLYQQPILEFWINRYLEIIIIIRKNAKDFASFIFMILFRIKDASWYSSLAIILLITLNYRVCHIEMDKLNVSKGWKDQYFFESAYFNRVHYDTSCSYLINKHFSI